MNVKTDNVRVQITRQKKDRQTCGQLSVHENLDKYIETLLNEKFFIGIPFLGFRVYGLLCCMSMKNLHIIWYIDRKPKFYLYAVSPSSKILPSSLYEN